MRYQFVYNSKESGYYNVECYYVYDTVYKEEVTDLFNNRTCVHIDRKNRIAQLSAEFEMEKALNDKIISYSHGMRQKIVIMGVLICNPKIWILDEPMTGLDPASSYKLKQMMKDHASRGNTVFFSTHVLEVAEKLCDKVAIINKGKIVYYGTLEELKDKYAGDSLEDIFMKVISHE